VLRFPLKSYANARLNGEHPLQHDAFSQELEMKMKDLRLNEENWVALAACVTLAVSVLIRLAAT
jgi:hypothetical protein